MSVEHDLHPWQRVELWRPETGERKTVDTNAASRDGAYCIAVAANPGWKLTYRQVAS